MKIRNGFVSNSSSSSYIVRIEGLDFKEFAERLYAEYSWADILSLTRAKQRLQKWEEMFEEAKKSDGYINKTWKEEADKLKKTLDEINPDNQEEVVTFMLDFYQINCAIKPNGVELSHFTSMHNDFDSSMSPEFQEIIMYFLFDTKYNVICEREAD